MNAFIEACNQFAEAWTAWLWRATWQGAIVIALAWVLTLILRSTPATLRAWIWRLAYVKLLLLLVWTSPINVPLLPAAQESEDRNHELVIANQESLPSPIAAVADEPILSASEPPTENAPAVAADVPFPETEPAVTPDRPLPIPQSNATPVPALVGVPPATNDPTDIPDSPFPTPHCELDLVEASVIPNAEPIVLKHSALPTPNSELPQLTWQSILLLTWSLGALACTAWLVLGICSLRRMLKSSAVLNENTWQTLLAKVAGRMGVRRRVQLRTSEEAKSPFLVRVLRPTIILPPPMVAGISVENRRLVLAHELAHVRRHDLAWNWLALVVRLALYFHPLVWFAHRQSRMQQEMACDELVMLRLEAEAHKYAEMLVTVLKQINFSHRPAVVALGLPGTLGMSATFKTLSRRLIAMKHIRRLSRKQMAVTACAFTLVGAVAILPWRLVAQESAPATTPPAASSPSEPEGTNSTPVPSDPPAAERPVETHSVDPFFGTVPFLEDKQLGEPNTAADQNSNTLKVPSQEVSKLRDRLVGTWRGGKDETPIQWTFRADGTYDVSYGRPGQVTLGKGRWSTEGDTLIVEAQKDSLTPTLRGLPRPGWAKVEDSANEGTATDRLMVSLVDDNFWRYKDDAGNAYFYRRVPEKPKEGYAGPENLRRVAELADLTLEESQWLNDWLEAYDKRKEEKDQFSLDGIDRVAKARAGQLDFAKLFKLTPEEAAAYIKVWELTNWNYWTVFSLAQKEQLTPLETSAVMKVSDFPLPWIQTISDSLGPDPRRHIGEATAGKLNNLVSDLRSWLQSTVYTSPPSPYGRGRFEDEEEGFGGRRPPRGRSAPKSVAPKATTKPADPPETKPAPPEAKPELTETTKKYEQLLVGTWRGGPEKQDVAFYKDGTYVDFGVRIFPSRDGWGYAFNKGRGTWRIENDTLIMTNDRLGLWSKKHKPVQAEQASPKILVLDDSFLRLRFFPQSTAKNAEGKYTFFFHRVDRSDEKALDERYAEVHSELRPLVAAARLTPQEAVMLAQYLENKKIDVNSNDFKIIGRVFQASRRQIMLADLFGMTEEEVTTFLELMRQVSEEGHFVLLDHLADLAANGQLRPAEVSAFEKVRNVYRSFRNSLRRIDGAVEPQHKNQPLPSAKFLAVLGDLAQWFNEIVGTTEGAHVLVAPPDPNRQPSQRASDPKRVTQPSHGGEADASRRALEGEDGKRKQEFEAAVAKAKEMRPLLIGTWRGGTNQREVVFHPDGTFEDFGADILVRLIPMLEYERGRGKWNLGIGQGGSVQLRLERDDGNLPWTKAEAAEKKELEWAGGYEILRLDDSLLRIRLDLGQRGSGYDENPRILLFRRVDEKPLDERFAGISPTLRPLAVAARLTPGDAAELAEWLKTDKIKIGEEDLKAIERIREASQRKVTLAELFGMTDEEVAAFRELLKQTPRNRNPYEYFKKLAAAGQLSAAELRAFKKIQSVYEAFRKPLLTVLPEGGMREWYLANGDLPSPGAKGRFEAFAYSYLNRFMLLLVDLDQQFTATVFSP